MSVWKRVWRGRGRCEAPPALEPLAARIMAASAAAAAGATPPQLTLSSRVAPVHPRFEPIRESQISRAMTARYMKDMHEHAEVGGGLLGRRRSLMQLLRRCSSPPALCVAA